MKATTRWIRWAALLSSLFAILAPLSARPALAWPPAERRIEREELRDRSLDRDPVQEAREREAVRRALRGEEGNRATDEIAKRIRAVADPPPRPLVIEREPNAIGGLPGGGLGRLTLRESLDLQRRADEARAEAEIDRVRSRVPAPLRSLDGDRPPPAAAPRDAVTPAPAARPSGYDAAARAKVADLAGRLGDGALVMDAASFDAASRRLSDLPRPPAPAKPSTATIAFDGSFAVVRLPGRDEVVRVEVPPARLDEPGHLAILKEALARLPALLAGHPDRVSALVWVEARRRYEPTGIVPPRESRRDLPPRARVALR